MDIFLGILQSIFNCVRPFLNNSIKEGLEHARRVDVLVSDLEKIMRDLKVRRDDVQQNITAAKLKHQSPTKEAETWLQRVQPVEGQVEEIKREYDQRVHCLGDFSPNCWSNYRIGSRAADKLLELKELYNEGEKFVVLAFKTPPPPVHEMPTTSTVTGQDCYLQKALRYLRHEEEEEDDGVEGTLGIWGMGGVGKTTLLTQINNSLVGVHGFDHVMFVEASKGCTVEKLQEKILKNLGLSEGHDAAFTIYTFLKDKNFLLLLDDLWEHLDLKKIGIPHPLGAIKHLHRKVILTSRSQNVCSMMQARMWIRVGCLRRDDAWRLFRVKVGDKTINSHPRIRRLAKKVAKQCHGLPLSLVTIGRAMSTKSDPQEWEDAIVLLHNSHLIPGMKKSIFPLLKFSYDHLEDDTIKDCFLACSLWPEDFNIHKDDLIQCWMGLDLLDRFDIDVAYALGHSIIRTLQEACLLEQGRDQPDWLQSYVKMHDVIREMALWIASERGEKWMVDAGVHKEEERWCEAQIISLMGNKIEALPSRIPSCPKLTALMLRRNKLNIINLQSFHALTYLDLGSNPKMDGFPTVICGLVELQYLNLSHVRIPSLPKELNQLKKLKYLLLRNSGVSYIPQGLISELEKLRVLDLYNSKAVKPANISLVDQLDHSMERHLKALGINVFTISELHRLAELPSISIRALGICLLDVLTSLPLLAPDILGSQNMMSTLKQLHIAYGSYSLQELLIERSHHQCHHEQALHLETLEFAELHSLKKIIWKGVAPKDLLPRLRKVTLGGCSQLKHVTWVLHLPSLEVLNLSRCKNLKHVIQVAEIEEVEERAVFPSLRFLSLKYLAELASICDRAFTFPSLEEIKIQGCPGLKKLPFKLQTNYNKLQKIRGSEEWWNGLEWEDDNIKTSLLPFFEKNALY